jgi:hypothetical protein
MRYVGAPSQLDLRGNIILYFESCHFEAFEYFILVFSAIYLIPFSDLKHSMRPLNFLFLKATQ